MIEIKRSVNVQNDRDAANSRKQKADAVQEAILNALQRIEGLLSRHLSRCDADSSRQDVCKP